MVAFSQEQATFLVKFKNEKASVVFNSIETIYDVRFSYQDSIISNKFISLEKKKRTLSEILEEIETNSTFSFEKINQRYIIVKEKEKNLSGVQILDNILITTGVGNHQMMTAQFYRWKYTKRMITSGSLGTMGVGLPFAIGAQIANPNSLVVCLDGDGSFNMTSNDLATIAYLNFNIFEPMADQKTFAPSFAPTIIASVAISNISNII